MKNKLLLGAAVVFAAVLSLAIASEYAGAAAKPELIVIGPSSATVDSGGTIVLRGAYIKGQGKDAKFSLHVGFEDTKSGLSAGVRQLVHHGNVVMADVELRAKQTATAPMRVILTARNGKRVLRTDTTILVTVIAPDIRK